jgi:hypothetical protein
MNDWVRYMKWFFVAFLLGAALITMGCEGTDTRDKVDDAVEEMAGKKDVERYKQMKDDIGKIQTQQEERYRQLDQDEKKE